MISSLHLEQRHERYVLMIDLNLSRCVRRVKMSKNE